MTGRPSFGARAPDVSAVCVETKAGRNAVQQQERSERDVRRMRLLRKE